MQAQEKGGLATLAAPAIPKTPRAAAVNDNTSAKGKTKAGKKPDAEEGCVKTEDDERAKTKVKKEVKAENWDKGGDEEESEWKVDRGDGTEGMGEGV